MTKVAVLDDWQGVARGSTDWSAPLARAEVVFFAEAFDDEDDAAAKLADFEIVLSMRERTKLAASLINRLPKLRMLGITGAHHASLDTPACTARSILVCNTSGGRSRHRGRPGRVGARSAAGSGAGDSRR
jgi:phosphoglycerate dehydrogenase-like enzyme